MPLPRWHPGYQAQEDGVARGACAAARSAWKQHQQQRRSCSVFRLLPASAQPFIWDVNARRLTPQQGAPVRPVSMCSSA